MFLLKTKGTAKISDYVQIRNDDFILIALFPIKNSEKNLCKIFKEEEIKKIKKKISNVKFGKLEKI
ncbi:MAG: hypothetical protein B6I24_05215 [Bacteroidetes bacterium 4572_128]|nr:MAG: hypothetical protein B6I24_05215 [Bacteroidetes bacterium 4572_128]